MTSSRNQASLTWLPLSPIATALFVIFAASVVVAALPPRLMDPLWQLRLTDSLIDNAPIALLGLAFIHLQAYLEPDESPSHATRDLVARFAVAATLGYLLLMPLQILATGQLLLTARSVEVRRSAAIQSDFNTMRQTILAASSSQDLQQRLQRLKRLRMPLVAPGDQSTPLEPLRQQLLSGLLKARGDALRQLNSSSRPRAWLLLTRGARNLACSLALAAGFAAGARNRSAPVPLLAEFTSLLQGGLFRFPVQLRPGPPGSRSVVDEEYFSAIVDSEPESLPEGRQIPRR